MNKNINLVAVSYLNTKPFLAGLEKFNLQTAVNQDFNLQIQLASPAICAQQLENGQAQIGLIPVAKIPFIKNAKIISDFCIGAVESVRTVCLFSKIPLAAIKTIYLDYQSKTSAQLIQILARYYWKISPVFKTAPIHFEENLTNLDSFLMIGDRAIGLETQFEYVYDLAKEWQQFTSLPFVFAAWVATTDLNNDFLVAFNNSLKTGLDKRRDVAKEWQPNFPNFDVADYFYKAISYEWDEQKRKGLQHFFELAIFG